MKSLKKKFLESKLIKKISLFLIRIFPFTSCSIYFSYFVLIIYNYFNDTCYLANNKYYLIDPFLGKYVMLTTINQYNILPWAVISVGL